MYRFITKHKDKPALHWELFLHCKFQLYQSSIFCYIKFTVILFAVAFLSLEKIPLPGPCTPKIEDKFCKIKDNLNPTENWEASEKSHRSSKNPQLICETVPLVSLYLVIRGCVQVDVEDVKLVILSFANWMGNVLCKSNSFN